MYGLSTLDDEDLAGLPAPAPSVHTHLQCHTKWTMASFLHINLCFCCVLFGFSDLYLLITLLYLKFLLEPENPSWMKHIRPSSSPFDEEGTLSCCPEHRVCPQIGSVSPSRRVSSSPVPHTVGTLLLSYVRCCALDPHLILLVEAQHPVTLGKKSFIDILNI